MLFESLDKLKRSTLFSAILLIALGAIILICPEIYIPSLILVFGYTLVITAIVFLLDFLSSKKSLMGYLKFSGALVLLIIGLCVLIFRGNTMRILAWLFGFLLVVDGGRTLFNSFVYARRSRRRGWWVLAILAVLLIVVGVVLFLNPFWDTPVKLMKVIGCSLLFSAFINAIRLVWTWPIRNTNGGDIDGE